MEKEKGDRQVPTDQKPMYYVLIYHDGCTLIPKPWVNTGKRTYVWPAKPILSRPRMHELKPDRTWGCSKYEKHLGPYNTFQEALKIEGICSQNVSSADDSEAIERTVNRFLHGEKRIIKPTIPYSPTDNKPPSKYIVQENRTVSLGKQNQDTDAIPPSQYVAKSTKQDETRTPYLFDDIDSFSTNDSEHLDSRHAESLMTPPKAEKKSRNEGPGKRYAVPNIPDVRDALNIEHRLRNPETGVVESHFDSQSPEISVLSIPVCAQADEISGETSVSKEANKKVATDVRESERVSPSLLVMSLSKKKKM